MIIHRLILRLSIGLMLLAVVFILTMLQATKALPYMGELAYISTKSAFNRIYLMDVQRQFSVYLERNFVNDCCLTWSPDGRLLTLVVDMSSDGSTDIFTMNFRAPPQRLTNERGADLYPAYSPDGSQIAYTSYGYGDPQIYLMNADGSGIRRLTGQEGVVNLNPRPVWSFDGQTVLFSDFDNMDTLLAVPSDCLDPCDQAIHPAFSTKGLELMTTTFITLDTNRLWLAAFNRAPDGGYGVYVLDMESSIAPERLTINPNLASPSVAVYGHWIAFASGARDKSQLSEESHLYVLDASCIGQPEGCAGSLQRITSELSTEDSLSWSPDGRWLAFVTVVHGQSQLNVLDSACIQTLQDCSTFIRQLPVTSLRYMRPAWRPQLP